MHRSAAGVVDGAGHRDPIWLASMGHAFVLGLWLVRRHTKPHERRPTAAAIALASLYLLSLNALGLLSVLDNEHWRQASVAGRGGAVDAARADLARRRVRGRRVRLQDVEQAPVGRRSALRSPRWRLAG